MGEEKERKVFHSSSPIPQHSDHPPISWGGVRAKSPLMCRAPQTLLNLLTGCERGGIWPGCYGNCGGSSQTLGNPPVTLADLSPPQPMDNGSARSRGPGCLSGQRQQLGLTRPASSALLAPVPQQSPRPPQIPCTLLLALMAWYRRAPILGQSLLTGTFSHNEIRSG